MVETQLAASAALPRNRSELRLYQTPETALAGLAWLLWRR